MVEDQNEEYEWVDEAEARNRWEKPKFKHWGFYVMVFGFIAFLLVRFVFG